MILNAQLFTSTTVASSYSDFPVELSYENSNSSFSPNSSPSPSLSKSTPSPKPTVSTSKERRVFDLPCAICACPATGYHYNVASCNGCKTFFRRCVLSKSSFRCIRSDSNCLTNLRQYTDGSRIKCRSCRLDRCLQQGMRKEAVTSGFLSTDIKSSADVYVAAISLPSTSNAIQKVTETASCLRQSLRLISKFRKCNVRLEELDLPVKSHLNGSNFLDTLSNYTELTSFDLFKRDLPEWLTLDLVCSMEFAKRLPDLEKFSDDDKEELIRCSCFTIAIAIQAIESYFEKQKKVIMPDGTDLFDIVSSGGTKIDATYYQMFVAIMDPLNREKFTIDELVLTLQMLFFTIATPDNLSKEGKMHLEVCVQSCMQSLLVLLITQDNNNFSARYGALTSLNEQFIKISSIHKQKMKEADSQRQKLRDLLIEQLVFDYRDDR